jgi:transposase
LAIHHIIAGWKFLMNKNYDQNEIILGVDTHLDVHVGAVVNAAGKLLGTQSISVNTQGYLDLLSWASSFGNLTQAGIEGTGIYGADLCSLLTDNRISVFEVNRPDRVARRRIS